MLTVFRLTAPIWLPRRTYSPSSLIITRPNPKGNFFFLTLRTIIICSNYLLCRINGIVMNSPEFAEAFRCSVGSKMNPPKKCKTWWSTDNRPKYKLANGKTWDAGLKKIVAHPTYLFQIEPFVKISRFNS